MTTPASAAAKARSLLADPFVLDSAWWRLRGWYATGEYAPQPEYALARLDRDHALQELGAAILAKEYAPAASWPLIPYPKKGGALRHYCQPSVRDQLAAIAHAIVLAPVVEPHMAKSSFGNRWFRGVYRDFRDEPPKWKQRPFSLADAQPYQPYRRAHGLFRRVCNWTVHAMLDATSDVDSSTDGVVTPDDYPVEQLPGFVRQDWWRRRSAKVYHGRLDLRLAYPSVDLDVLFQRLQVLVLKDVALDSVAYPRHIVEALRLPDVRVALCKSIVELLGGVRYSTADPAFDGLDTDALFFGKHADQALPRMGSRHKGLPTGLAVSGLLLNCYLTHLDSVCDTFVKPHPQFAFVRFADDMVVLAMSQDDLIHSLDVVWEGVAGNNEPLGYRTPDTVPSNLRIHWNKLGPEPLRAIVSEYLIHHWHAEAADEYPREKATCTCGEVRRPDDVRQPHKSAVPRLLRQWWHDLRTDRPKRSCELAEALADSTVTRDSLGAFVTYLVERLSALGNESVLAQFGPAANERLDELHGLVRMQTDDAEVREDTRVTFAANALSRAWLPDGPAEQPEAVARAVRESIRQALWKAPWRFKLWRPVVRAATRCVRNAAPSPQAAGALWLARQLELVALQPAPTDTSIDEQDGRAQRWLKAGNQPHECLLLDPDDRAVRALSQSAHRAAFWHALAEALLDLNRWLTAVHWSEAEARPSRVLSSSNWIHRVIPTEKEGVERVHDWLADIPRWAGILYPDGSAVDAISEPESRALLASLVARATRNEILLLVNAVAPSKDCADLKKRLGQRLGIPEIPGDRLRRRLNATMHDWIVGRDGRPVGARQRAVALATLGGSSQAPASQTLAILLKGASATGRAQSSTTLAEAFGVLHEAIADCTDIGGIDLDGLSQAIRAVRRNPRSAEHRLDTWTRLREYERWRRRHLALWQGPSAIRGRQQPSTIYRILWGRPAAETGATPQWELAPDALPAVGLPLRVAAQLMRTAISQTPESGWPGSWPVSWRLPPTGFSFLASGRQRQRASRATAFDAAPTSAPRGKKLLACGASRADWEVPPHPAFFLPYFVGGISSRTYAAWCHALLFLTVLEGHERFLDTLMAAGPSATPFQERWDLRGRTHLPGGVWRALDSLLRAIQGPIESGDDLLDQLARELDTVLEGELTDGDFLAQLIEVELTWDGFESPRAIQSFPLASGLSGHRSKPLNPTLEKMVVRIGQVSAHPQWSAQPGSTSFVHRYPHLLVKERDRIMGQVAQVLVGGFDKPKDELPTLVVLPEATVPASELRLLRKHVQQSGCSVLVGTFWREIRPPYAPLTPRGRRYLVNEAHLIVPLSRPSAAGGGLNDTATRRDNLSIVRDWVVQKPVPAYMEHAITQELRPRHPPGFEILPGRTWFRFDHPEWGSFTVAICSDLLDPRPWAALRGRILHLFMPAYNPDIDLYEALSWVRAYENYVNVVVTNHGDYGGSFVWTPRHQPEKELAKIRGNGLFVISDVRLPARALAEVQSCDPDVWIERERNKLFPKEPRERDALAAWKSPPPGFSKH